MSDKSFKDFFSECEFLKCLSAGDNIKYLFCEDLKNIKDICSKENCKRFKKDE